MMSRAFLAFAAISGWRMSKTVISQLGQATSFTSLIVSSHAGQPALKISICRLLCIVLLLEFESIRVVSIASPAFPCEQLPPWPVAPKTGAHQPGRSCVQQYRRIQRKFRRQNRG